MATEFIYVKEANVTVLREEIEADPGISTALDYIIVDGTDLHIFFVSDLSGAEVTALDAVVAAHTGTPVVEPPLDEPPPAGEDESDPTTSAVAGPFDVQSAESETFVQTNSETYVDVPGMSLTTRDLGGLATYVIRFGGNGEVTSSSKTLTFRILVDGVEVAVTKLMDANKNLLHFQHREASVVDGKVIKVQWKISKKTKFGRLDRRSLVIHGILDSSIVSS